MVGAVRGVEFVDERIGAKHWVEVVKTLVQRQLGVAMDASVAPGVGQVHIGDLHQLAEDDGEVAAGDQDVVEGVDEA